MTSGFTWSSAYSAHSVLLSSLEREFDPSTCKKKIRFDLTHM
jgi:hypothetical protein